MREIKFRAWDKREEKFYYFTLKDLFAEGAETELCELTYGKHVSQNTDYPYMNEEQYTGLNDKNGVEIYEGDIVKVKNKLNDRVGEYNTEIIYDKAMFKLKDNKTIFKDGYFWLSEVIGNIHQNKELL